MSGATRVRLATIRIDGGTQTRAALDAGVVAEYASALADGATFPPIVVFEDVNGLLWLADGFHRHAAAIEAGLAELLADVRQGSRREAVLFSAGANADHGARRTNADKRRAVETLLHDDEWRKWSDREIARRCRVVHPFVGQVRASLVTVTSDPTSQADYEAQQKFANAARLYTTKHGQTATMDTARIGRQAAPVVVSAPPAWLPRAGEAAIGTVEPGGQQIFIVPSDDDVDFVYVSVVSTDAHVEGLKQPVRREWVPVVVRALGVPTDRATWTYHAAARWAYPEWLFDSREDWFSQAVLGRGGAA